MTKIRIELNRDGFKELLNSSEVTDLVKEHAEKIADRCGDGYESKTYRGSYGGGRVLATVRPVTLDALKDEAENKTLEKAVHGV